MYSGDETYDDEITSGPIEPRGHDHFAAIELDPNCYLCTLATISRPLVDERGSGPDRYPTILRDASGRPTDIG